MGVPGFSTWLKQRYPEAFKDPKRTKDFDHVYIDLQSTLHTVTRKARSRQGFHLLLHRRLDELLSNLSPTTRVVLAMDGPAPLAKLLEQRRRRRREAEKLQSMEATSSTDRASSSSSSPNTSTNNRKDPHPSFDLSSLYLTTGTLFMLEVHNSLSYYICKRLIDPQYKHASALQYELSDSTVKGEGELKILSRLLLHPNSIPTASSNNKSNNNNTTSHVVVGADSDLTIMTLISGQPNVYVYDDNPRPGNKPNNPRRRSRRSKSTFFSRDALESIWRRDHLGYDAPSWHVTSMALDLALLSIMSNGNDYLPSCQGLLLESKGKPGLWDLYLDMRRQEEWKGRFLVQRSCTGCDSSNSSNTNDTTTTNNNTTNTNTNIDGCFGVPSISIDGEMLSALLYRYQVQKHAAVPTSSTDDDSDSDDDDDDDEYQDDTDTTLLSSSSTTTTINNTNSTPTPRSFFDGNSKKKSWLGAWSFGITPSTERAAAAILSSPSPLNEGLSSRLPADPAAYIHGLEWVLSMYATGSIHDYRFAYPATSPSVSLLIKTLRDPGSRSTSTTVELPRSTDQAFRQPLIPAACALALLPARGRRQAASPLRFLMDADSPVAEIYAVCKECQKMAGDIKAVAVELDAVRKKLATVQAELGAEAFDPEGRVQAEGDLASALEGWESAGERLRQLLGHLSRSQQEHLKEMHPYKPFPTDELETAVMAVERERYAPHERRLAKFGREVVFSKGRNNNYSRSGSNNKNNSNSNSSDSSDSVADVSAGMVMTTPDNTTANTAAATTNAAIHGDEFMSLPGWLRDCSRFAGMYPKVANTTIVREAVHVVKRNVLPLYPYMQPKMSKKKGGIIDAKKEQQQQQPYSKNTTTTMHSSSSSVMRMSCHLQSQQHRSIHSSAFDHGMRFGARIGSSRYYSNSVGVRPSLLSMYHYHPRTMMMSTTNTSSSSSSSSIQPLHRTVVPSTTLISNTTGSTSGGTYIRQLRSAMYSTMTKYVSPMRYLRMLKF